MLPIIRALACCLLVAGCTQAPQTPRVSAAAEAAPTAARADAPGGLLGGLFGSRGAPEPAPGAATRPRMPTPLARVALAGGDVVVAGPENFCIDPTTVQRRAERGFALIASCRILSGGRAGAPIDPAIVTVTVGPRADVTDLPSPADLAALSDTALMASEQREGFVAANLEAGGKQYLNGGDERHWRGAFLQGDRLVGLALYAPEGSALAGAQGFALLERVKERIVALSPGGTGDLTRENPGPTQPGGLLGRLFDR